MEMRSLNNKKKVSIVIILNLLFLFFFFSIRHRDCHRRRLLGLVAGTWEEADFERFKRPKRRESRPWLRSWLPSSIVTTTFGSWEVDSRTRTWLVSLDRRDWRVCRPVVVSPCRSTRWELALYELTLLYAGNLFDLRHDRQSVGPCLHEEPGALWIPPDAHLLQRVPSHLQHVAFLWGNQTQTQSTSYVS